MPRRLSATLLLIALLAVSLTGCDRVRAGTRCRVGSPAGRDATHVLLCQGGRWKRVMTIGQAAQFVIANLPGSVTSANGATATAVAGGAINPFPKFQVLRRNGQPLGGAKVTLSGSGLASSATGETGPDGVVNFVAGPLANGTVGTWNMTASVDGTDLSTSVAVTTSAAAPAAVTILSGGSQSGPAGQTLPEQLVARLTDKFGNPVPNRVALIGWLGNESGGQTTTDANGVARFTLSAKTTAGIYQGWVIADTVGCGVCSPFTLTVVAGTVGDVEIESGDSQSAATNAAFGAPLRVKITDLYGNVKSGATVSFAAVPNAGATASLSSPTAVTDSNGIAQITATAGGTAGTYLVTATAGAYDASFTLTNT